MITLSDDAIRANCPHCSITAQRYFFGLEEMEDFRIFCDTHPLTEGHILLVPKEHIACVGAYTKELFTRFRKAHDKVSRFMESAYGSYAVFEHGVFGQSVYHSHVHFIPFRGGIDEIIPEGTEAYVAISDISKLKEYYQKDGGYLFVSIGKEVWVVDPKLTTPRFFRKRFAGALGREEREDWKAMHNDDMTMKQIGNENKQVQIKWKALAQE